MYSMAAVLTQLRRLGHVFARQPFHGRAGDVSQSCCDTPDVGRVTIEVSRDWCADHGDVHHWMQVHLLRVRREVYLFESSTMKRRGYIKRLQNLGKPKPRNNASRRRYIDSLPPYVPSRGAQESRGSFGAPSRRRGEAVARPARPQGGPWH